jgi:hypothetical protein
MHCFCQHFVDAFIAFVLYCRDPTRAEVQEVMEAINDAAVTPDEFQEMLIHEPKAVVFRNEIRMVVSRMLAVNSAAAQGKRLVVWHSEDTFQGPAQHRGQRLPAAVQRVVNMAHAKKTGDLNAWSCFYEDIPYVFIDSKYHEVGRAKNNTCIGKALLLDHREPPDDPTQKVRTLQFPPLAVFVKPAIVDVGQACHNLCTACPPGCIAIPIITTTFKLTLPHPIALPGGQHITTVHVCRRNIPLGDGFAFTDYYTQGMSFGLAKWLADMRPPATGSIDRASVAVVLSRFQRWSLLKALTPLWPSETPDMTEEQRRKRQAAKDHVIDFYWNVAKMDPSLREEMQRLKDLAATTEARLVAKYADLLPQELFTKHP